MKTIFSKTAYKAILRLDNIAKQRIKTAIDGLTQSPPQGDIKQMQGYSIKSYRLRVGKYRIVYRYDQNVLFISDIDSRGGIYK